MCKFTVLIFFVVCLSNPVSLTLSSARSPFFPPKASVLVPDRTVCRAHIGRDSACLVQEYGVARWPRYVIIISMSSVCPSALLLWAETFCASISASRALNVSRCAYFLQN